MALLRRCTVPVDGVRCLQPNTGAYVGGQDIGTGSLYISEANVAWIKESGEGFTLEYPSICLHAISTDLASFPKEHLYLMVDSKLGDEDMGENNEDNDSGEEAEIDKNISEVRFSPADKNALSDMYQSMCDCQSLHPDAEADLSEEEGYFDGEDGDGEIDLTAQGRATLQRLEGMLASGNTPDDGSEEPRIGHTNGVNAAGDADEAMETGQFEDADD